MSSKGMVFDIQRFSIHDGPGIRTTVFLKGCPLSCLWCHNPESQKKTMELSFTAEKCIFCGKCIDVCPVKAHENVSGKHIFHREKCILCGKCAEVCYAKAIEAVGKEMSVSEIIGIVLKDKPFYENSGGGMTVSGGEPLAQPSFTYELLSEAKKNSLHTCLDTSGFASAETCMKMLPVTDLFLYDIKATDEAVHKKLTGVSFAPIIANLRMLDKAGASTILRCPLVPGLNDDTAHLLEIGRIASSLANVRMITIHPYHPLGRSKSERMGMKYPLEEMNDFADDKLVEKWLQTVRSATDVEVELNG